MTNGFVLSAPIEEVAELVRAAVMMARTLGLALDENICAFGFSSFE